MKFKRTYLILIVVPVFFNSCITANLSRKLGPHKPDKITAQKEYYVNNMNTVVIQFSSDLDKTTDNTDYFCELNMDKVINISRGDDDEYLFTRLFNERGIKFVKKAENTEDYSIYLNRNKIQNGISDFASRDDIVFIIDTLNSAINQNSDVSYNTLVYGLPVNHIPGLFPMNTISVYFDRNRKQLWYKYPLYPFTVSLDIITFPVQAIVDLIAISRLKPNYP